MVRVGGMSYRRSPKAEMGNRNRRHGFHPHGALNRRREEIYGWWLGIDRS